jgi:hypothetical protein
MFIIKFRGVPPLGFSSPSDSGWFHTWPCCCLPECLSCDLCFCSTRIKTTPGVSGPFLSTCATLVWFKRLLYQINKLINHKCSICSYYQELQAPMSSQRRHSPALNYTNGSQIYNQYHQIWLRRHYKARPPQEQELIKHLSNPLSSEHHARKISSEHHARKISSELQITSRNMLRITLTESKRSQSHEWGRTKTQSEGPKTSQSEG